LSEEAYLERISRKTACLMAACCKGGALVSNATPEQAEALYGFGLNLGMAFQIIDDVLDYTGAEEEMGKPAGNDLRQGLITLPLIHALQAQNNGHIEAIQEILTARGTNDDRIDPIVRWVAQGPGIHHTLEEAERFAQQARNALSHFPPSPNRDVLAGLTGYVLARTR
jgi:geranylgeranyl pyrophosphate synthase